MLWLIKRSAYVIYEWSQRSKFDDMNSDTSDVEDNPAPQKVRKSRFDERREPVEEKSEPANKNKSER